MNVVANNDYIERIQEVILRLHDAESTWVESVHVREVFQGRMIWQGPVEVFTLRNHPKAKRCFAWSYKDVEDLIERFVAVLEIPPVKSAHDAVKVAIAHEVRKSQKK